MNEIAVYQGRSIKDQLEWAENLATSSILPAQYRRQPANLVFAAEYADALGIPRINALTSIHVIDGKPTASADLMAAKVRGAGHKLRISGNDTVCKVQLIRNDDPDFTFEVEWNMERARVAGLVKPKSNWEKYPAAMLRARAISEIVRMAASDVMAGMVYTPEELGATIDQEGNPVDTPRGNQPPVQATAERTDAPRQASQGGAAGLLDAVQPQAQAPGVDVDDLLDRMADVESEDALKALWTDSKDQLGDRRAEVFDFVSAKLGQLREPAAAPAESTPAGPESETAPGESAPAVAEQTVIDAEVVDA